MLFYPCLQRRLLPVGNIHQEIFSLGKLASGHLFSASACCSSMSTSSELLWHASACLHCCDSFRWTGLHQSTSAIPCAAKETRSDLQRSCKKSEEPHSCHGLLSDVGSVLLAHVDKGIHLIALHDLQSKESLKHQGFSSCSSRTSQQHCLNYRQHTNAIPHITVYARLLGIAEESTPDQPCRRWGQYGRHSLS